MPGSIYLTNYELRVLIRSLEATEKQFRSLGVEDFYDALLAKLIKTRKNRVPPRQDKL